MGFWNELKEFVSDPIGYITDAIMPDIPEPQAPEEQRGTTVNRRGGSYSIPVLYSQNVYWSDVKIGGIESYIATSGTDNKYLHLTYVLCHGMARSVQVYRPGFHNMGYWSTDLTHGDSKYSSDTTQPMVMNNSGQILWKGFVSSANNTYTPSWHNDKNIYPGLTVFKVRLEYPDGEYNPNDNWLRQKPTLSFYVQGIDDDYAGTDKSIVSWMQKFLLSDEYGAGLATADIDSLSFYNIVSIHNTLSRTQAYYKMQQDSAIVANIKTMLWHTATALIYEDGKYILRLDPNFVGYELKQKGLSTAASLATIECITHTVAEKDVVGGVQIQTMPQTEVPYQWSYSFFKGETTTVEYPENPDSYESSLVSNFGANSKPAVDKKNVKKIEVNGNAPAIEYRYLEGRINNSISVQVSPKHANIRIFDIIAITYPKADLDNQQYVVTKVTRNADMSLSLNCKQYLLDANTSNKWLTPNMTELLYIKGVSINKLKLLKPVGEGLDNNTQVDEFIPNFVLPNPTNLTITSTLDGNLVTNGTWYTGLQVDFDKITHPLINNFKVYSQTPSSDEWVYIGQSNSNSFKLRVGKLITGITYDIKVVPVSKYTSVGDGTVVSVTIPYREGENAIRAILSSSTYSTGIAIDSSGGEVLDEDGGLLWCQLQSPPAAGTGCSLGTDAQHDVYDAWEDWEPSGAADNGNGGAWYSTHPLTGCISSTVDGYYYPNPAVEINRVYLNPGEKFVAVGKATVSVVGFDDNDTSNGKYALYDIGWKIYNSSNTLLYTFTASSPTSNAGNYHGAGVVGNIAGQSYAVPYFHVYGAGTDGCDQVAIHDYDFDIIRQVYGSVSYKNLDTSVLTGAVGAREIDIVPTMKNPKFKDGAGNTFAVNRLAEVSSVRIVSAETETLNVTGSYIGLDASSFNPEIKVIDISTNTVTDADIDLYVYGLPNVIQVKNDKGIFTDFVLVENQIR